ncbi:hypothetical protein T484DRAFT_2023638, partial [Baffinella frigidus]
MPHRMSAGDAPARDSLTRFFPTDPDLRELAEERGRGSSVERELAEVYERPPALHARSMRDRPLFEGRVAVTITCARGLRGGAAGSAPGGSGAAMYSDDSPAWMCTATFQACGEAGAFRTHGVSGSEPRWEEFRSMHIAVATESRLVLDVFRADLLLGKAVGSSIGTGYVSLEDAAAAKDMFDAWVPLFGPANKAVGEVHLVMMFTSAPKPAASPPARSRASQS